MLLQLIILIGTFFLIYKNLLKKPSTYPPGHWGFPFFGYISIFGKKNIEQQLLDLRKDHGDVILWRFGTRLMVFLFDYKLIKEVLSSINFTERPVMKMSTYFEGKNTGLVSSNGIEWHLNRRFTLRLLRDLGMGKNRLVNSVHIEARELIESFKKCQGEPQPIPSSLSMAVLNVIWQMIASERYEEGNPDFEEFHKLTQELLDTAGILVIPDIPGIFNWIEYVLPQSLLKWIFEDIAIKKLRGKYTDHAMKIIKKHEENLNEEDPVDFIDHYLVEMKKEKTEENSHMCYIDLVSCIRDLHHAGHETTTSTLIYSIFYLASFPAAQQRLQEEIDSVLLGEDLATLEDKPMLNYTEAFIHETHRVASFTSFGVMRCASADTIIQEYFIPKGTIIHPAVFSCHNDPKYWKEPEKFLPERFLDETGKFVHPKEGFIPFGSGKRQCIGESLSRMELFIFLTSLVKYFNFTVPPGSSIDCSPDPSNPFGHLPRKEQNIIITYRKNI